jgi:hypothetical protein
MEPPAHVPPLRLEALEFINLFSWCVEVIDLTPEFEEDELLGIYRVNFVPKRGARSPAWILVGDVPPTVLPMENNWSVAETVENYLLNLVSWARAVERGESDMLRYTPVLYRFSNRRMPPTTDNAVLVRSAISKMRLILEPLLSGVGGSTTSEAALIKPPEITGSADDRHRWPVVRGGATDS